MKIRGKQPLPRILRREAPVVGPASNTFALQLLRNLLYRKAFATLETQKKVDLLLTSLDGFDCRWTLARNPPLQLAQAILRQPSPHIYRGQHLEESWKARLVRGTWQQDGNYSHSPTDRIFKNRIKLELLPRSEALSSN
jgi:hypothetical protein